MRLAIAVALAFVIASSSSRALASQEPEPTDTSTPAGVVVRAARLPAPFDRDTVLRLTSEEIRELGVDDVASALEHVSEVFEHQAGRGGVIAQIRGARRGSLMVLIDGVPISDPFFGTFDASSVPITDVEEIRVSESPASPLDGPAGSGGVIEIITMAATGARRVDARARASDAPSFNAEATARGELIPGLAMRVSGGGRVDTRDFVIPDGAGTRPIDQQGRGAQGALLIETEPRGSALHASADLSVWRRRYVSPPSEQAGDEILSIDPELWVRASMLAEGRAGRWTLSGRLYAQRLERDSMRRTTGERRATADRVVADRAGLIARSTFRLDPRIIFDGAVTLLAERAENTDPSDPDPRRSRTEGSGELAQAAAGADLSLTDWLRVEASAGAALPLAGQAPWWPEAKLEVAVTSTPAEVRLTGARKGRLPSLRERFQLRTGNPDLEPEMATYTEARLIARPLSFLRVEASAYYRWIDGLIRFGPGAIRLENVGDVDTRGVDLRAEIAPDGQLSSGAAYYLTDAISGALGERPLDFTPRHRLELWARARFFERYGAWARLEHVGERSDGSVLLAPYQILDTGCWVRVDGARLSLRIDNLLDRAYEARASVPAIGRTVWIALEASI